MECKEISGSWVFLPEKKIVGIVHFLGGAFVATAPQISYRTILEKISTRGFVVIATPFVNTFNHFSIAREVLNRFETIVERLQKTNKLSSGYLPIYGIGHSMGCKLHILINSLYEVERAGNILISFNNYPANKAIPFFEQLNIASTWNIEFDPCPSETKKIIATNYNVRRNLLIKFNRDEIDQTNQLNYLLQNRFPDMITVRTLTGNHLTPLNQQVRWQLGNIYTPLDAFGQWFNQGISQSLNILNRELALWLNPMSAI